MKTSSVLIIMLFAFLAGSGCLGIFCPISIPQNTPRYCIPERGNSLAAQQQDYGIETPTPSMPFARLHDGLLQLKALLIKDPFLKSHADKLQKLGAFNELTRISYMQQTAHAPPIMSNEDFLFVANHFKHQPKSIGKYVQIPSDEEPFQKHMSEWISDELFADQRLAGSNPLSLNKLTFSDKVGVNWNELRPKLNKKFDWDGTVSGALNGMALKTAIDDGYLYVLYHPFADDLKTIEDNGDKDPARKMWKFMSPIALFASVPGKNSASEAKLLPIAIQMDHISESQVYTPKDGDLWTLAKLNVQLTDLETSQIVEHLSKVHLVSEGLCLVVERQLSKQHPLYVIMRYHCRGVLTANTFGAPVLLAKNNKLDKLFPYGYIGSNNLVSKTAKMIEWRGLKLKNNIKQRGVDDTKRLPYYPFRDDGAEIEKVIRLMMRDYVNAYYRSNREVRGDHEVQNYAREVSRDGKDSKVQLRGFPASFKTKKQLVNTFTQMIWLMTGQHASVNYPMADYVTYIPNSPLKLYDSERVSNTTYSPERLPNRAQTAAEATFAMSLASLRQDRLFDYCNKLKDPKGRAVVSRYFKHLKKVVDPLLEKRNEKRLAAGHLTYPYMQPRWVPNGIQT